MVGYYPRARSSAQVRQAVAEFESMLGYVRRRRPAAVVLENVASLLTPRPALALDVRGAVRGAGGDRRLRVVLFVIQAGRRSGGTRSTFL